MSDEQADTEVRVVEKALGDLMEHFEAVQIFVSRYDSANGDTVGIVKGAGNYFARIAQSREWVVKQDEASRQEMRGRE